MASIIKVDQIQTAAGGTPTAADLGINTTGTVLQVVYAKESDAIAVNSSQYDWLPLTITPKSNNSTLIVHMFVSYGFNTTDGANIDFGFKLLRDSNVVSTGANSDSARGGNDVWFSNDDSPRGGGEEWYMTIASGVLEVNNTSTAPSIFKIRIQSSINRDIYINRPQASATVARATSSMTIYEIAG